MDQHGKSIDNRKYPKVSIIVVNWNRPKDTVECLRSILELDYPNYEVIVVDNGSSDNSVRFIRQEFPHIILLENEKNLGFTGGNNQAMIYASRRDAEYFWLVNNDATVEPDTLSKLIDAAQSKKGIGLISPMIYFFGTSEEVQFSGFCLVPDEYSFRKFPVHAIPTGEIPDRIDLLVGAALLIKRRVVEDIGYLDDKYFAYGEDFEYCARAKRFGYRSIVHPSARVYHKDSQWREKFKSPMVVYLRSRNTYFFWMSMLHGRKRKFYYLLYFIADRISFFAVLKKENPPEAADACLDAVWAAIRGIGGPWDKNVKMPRIMKRILSWHPYFWVGLLRGDIKGILHASRNRIREWKRDVVAK